MSGAFQRAVGVELSGVKVDRSAICQIDLFPKNKRLVVSDILFPLEQNPHQEPQSDPDERIIKALKNCHKGSPSWMGAGVHAPTSLPVFMAAENLGKVNSSLFQPKDPITKWMLHTWKSLKPSPRPFLPYLQRPCEIYLRYLTPERFEIPEGMGANVAPIAARFQYLAPHLPFDFIESWPRASVTRVVTSLGLPKHLAREYTDFDLGLKSRDEILERISKKLPQLFFYDHDFEKMVMHVSCFHAFFVALSVVLQHFKQTETPPRGFPKSATWISLPVKDIQWNKVG